jgi:FkbM family methyltransferase
VPGIIFGERKLNAAKASFPGLGRATRYRLNAGKASRSVVWKARMLPEFIKLAGLKLISAGLKAPENPLDRFIEFTMLKQLLAELEIDCVLDVGANCGQFARHLRAIGYRGRIISFEPNPDEFARLQRSFSSDPAWFGHPIALGKQTGALQLKIPQLTVLGSFLDLQNNPGEQKIEQVEVRRLDELFPSLMANAAGAKVFLKMDTQGYDLNVFHGAEGCIDKIRALMSEISVRPLYKDQPRYLDSLATYERAGFDLYHLSVVNREPGGGLQELNAYLKRR